MSTQSVVHEVNAPQSVQQTQQTEIVVKKLRNPFDSATILSVSRKWPKLSKSISVDQIDVRGETPETDKKKVHVSKDLFDCPELKRLFGHDADVDSFLFRYCVPFPLKRAVYLLPMDLFDEVENFLTEHVQEREPLIEAAVNVYDAAIERAKVFLGPLFKQSDYPPKEVFRASFDFSWQYLEIGVSGKLKEVSADIQAREAAKMNATYVEASQAIQALLRTSMGELVNHLVDRLTPGPDGKKKVFRDSMLDNVNDFLKTFRSRNLTDDTDLATLVEQAQQLTNGISPENLRTNEGLRDNVQRGFEQIKAQLDAMIQVAPTREIRLTD